MCLIYVGFHGTCPIRACSKTVFEVTYRRSASQLHDLGRRVTCGGEDVAACACMDKLYVACISQYDETNTQGYRFPCESCRGQDAGGSEVVSTLPSNKAQDDRTNNNIRLRVQVAGASTIKKILYQMVDKYRVHENRYYDDHHQLFLDTKHLLIERLHEDCDGYEDYLRRAFDARDNERLTRARELVQKKSKELDATILSEVVERMEDLAVEYEKKQTELLSIHTESNRSGTSEQQSTSTTPTVHTASQHQSVYTDSAVSGVSELSSGLQRTTFTDSESGVTDQGGYYTRRHGR